MLLAILLLSACSGVERGRYGVTELEIEGAEALSAAALQACLITRERESAGITLGLREPVCGQAPFDSAPPSLRLWRWPWAEWPSFNPAVFDRDLERVARWYRARGYYDARVKSVVYDPPEAATPGAHGACDPDAEECTVSILVTIDEGLPTLVSDLGISHAGALDAALERELYAELALVVGQPIDEAAHEASKRALEQALRRHSYASASVQGRVDVDTARRQARVTFTLEPGPRYRFGALRVSGDGELPERTIAAAAGVRDGEPYDPKTPAEIEAEVLALGAFSAVEVVEHVDPKRERVDLEVVVTPLAPDALRVGLGVLSGQNRRTDTSELASIPQWDFHLFGRYERRHVLGTLGKLNVDDRLRLIFERDFPRLTTPELGNVLGVGLNQPGLLEARTDLFARAVWDRGPDSFLGFTRSDIFFRVGVRRSLFLPGLVGTLAAQQDLLLVDGGADNVTNDPEVPTPNSYLFNYLEQDVRLDLRDEAVRTTRGAYFALNALEAVRSPASDWTALRLAPEARGFVPLPFGAVLAARAAVAGLFISSASDALDVESRALGPSTYRLRGGGANSNRGFLAGTLGAGLDGGIRRWEASLELRLALGSSLVVAGFADLGDVSADEALRLSHYNTTLGFGLRYYTVIGALRLDTGYRIPSLQRADGSDGIEDDASTVLFTDRPGAVHLTIGDPF